MRPTKLLPALLALATLAVCSASCWDRTQPTTDPLPNPIDDPTPIVEAGTAAGAAVAASWNEGVIAL